MDTNGDDPRYLVEVKDHRFEVSRGVHEAIELLREGYSTVEDIVEELRARGYAKATPERISRLIRKVLIPRGIVEPPAGEEPAPYQPRQKRSSFLRLQVPLVEPQVLSPLTNALGFLFRPTILTAMVLVGAAAHLFFYAQVLVGFHWSVLDLPLVDYVLLLLFMNLTTLFHELGHAAACRHFGCPHGKIGWGIYIYMLVLYTDVSAAWRLKRPQRAVVDLAGMYFELIIASGVLALYLWTSKTVFVYAFLLLDFSILSSLNPVLRRDGYWLVTDLTGNTNLRDANLRVLRGWWTKLTGKGKRQPREEVSSPTWMRITLQLYSAVTLIFSVLLGYWLVTRITAEIIPGAPVLLGQIKTGFGAEPIDYAGGMEAVVRLFFYLLFVLLVGTAAWRFVAALGRWLRGSESPGEDLVARQERLAS